MNKFNIKDFSEGGSLLRERAVNYIQIAKNTLESYPLTLAHGVQKDAIQNGWDACPTKTPSYVSKKWKFEFELIENVGGRTLFIMSDFGTSGLTGTMTSKDITEDNMPPEEERWARWESLAFVKGGEESLGARGQGKMILIASSKDFTIAYDSLRSKNGYRMGCTQATNIGCPVFHHDGDAGKKKIKEMLNLEPIDHIGSRVIIINPVDELIDSIKKGEFIGFIEETWWPIIHKLGGTIAVKYEGNVLRAGVPGIFPITDKLKETKTFKTWVKENVRIDFEGKKYTIKHLCFACNQEHDVPEIHRGVAAFRSGMKVDSVEFPERSLRGKVYGYAEFDEDVNKLLRKIEVPNHYKFKNIKIWRPLKDKIEEELEAFGNKKLGLGIDTRALENARRSSAENRAMSILRSVTKGWPFASKGGGGGDGGSRDVEVKDVGVRISNLKFPNPGNVPRLNYGEILDGFYTTLFNKTDKTFFVTFKGFVLSGDRILIELENKKFKLKPNSEIKTASYSFKATEKIFPTAGVYSLRFTLIDDGTKKKTQLDEITRRFWVDTDPELRGPFDVKRAKFNELGKPEIQRMEWMLSFEGDNRQTLYYNLDHPAYEHSYESEERLTKYLSEIFCFGALQLLVRQAEKGEVDKEKLEKLPFSVDKLLSKDPKTMYAEMSKAMSSIKFDVHRII